MSAAIAAPNSHAGVGDDASASVPRVPRGRWIRWLGWGLAWTGGLLVTAGAAIGLVAAIGPGWLPAGGRGPATTSCTAEGAMHRASTPAAESRPSDAERAPASAGPAGDPPAPPVPERSHNHREGSIEVVEVGVEAAALAETLRTEHALASRRGQTLLVMLTGRRCRPCRGVDQALADPRMQVALAGVRLVRVDLEVFREEIDELGVPRDIYPAFFLLDASGRVRDAIHGGEWGADVAENIAPVLGAFVRGAYHARRYERAPSARSSRL